MCVCVCVCVCVCLLLFIYRHACWSYSVDLAVLYRWCCRYFAVISYVACLALVFGR